MEHNSTKIPRNPNEKKVVIGRIMRIPSSPKVTDKGMIALSRQTLEGSTLSRLLHVPSDPN